MMISSVLLTMEAASEYVNTHERMRMTQDLSRRRATKSTLVIVPDEREFRDPKKQRRTDEFSSYGCVDGRSKKVR